MKAWYFAPALKHYRVIKATLPSGAVRLTDTWKLKHHSLPIPTVTATDRIIKATQHLASTIQGVNDAPPDELAAIEQLRALISNNSTPVAPTAPPTVQVPIEPPPAPTVDEQAIPTTEPQEHPVSIQPSPAPIFEAQTPSEASPFETNAGAPMPAFITQDDEEDRPVQPRYNLRRRANIINSQIDPAIIPGIDIDKPTPKYSRGLSAANHALQVYQLAQTMQANFPTENFACAILDDETGQSLEFRHLIKLDKYRDVWMKSFANELGRLAQGIRDIPGTDTIDFIPLSQVPKGEAVTYGRIVCTFAHRKTK